MAQHILTLEQLTIGNAGHTAACGLSAVFRSGSVSCVLGRNGVGKSTLLRTLSGYQPALDGAVWLDGISVHALHRSTLARKIAVVLTGRPQAENLRAEEVVLMGRAPYTGFFGRFASSDRQVAEAAMHEMGINALYGRRVRTLSDGEMQKVMIAKALAQHTEVMLLDEPTAFLDFQSKIQLMKKLKQLAERQDKIVILTTHEPELAMRLGTELFHFEEKLKKIAPETLREQLEAEYRQGT